MIVRRVALIVAALLIVATAIVGVSAYSNLTSRPKPPRIVMIAGGSGPYWQLAAEGARAAARVQGIELQIEFPSNDDVAQSQVAVLQRVNPSVCDGIAICPYPSVEVADAVREMGAPMKVLTFVANLPKSDRLCHVGPGNYSAGRLGAREVVEAAPDGAGIIVVGSRLSDRAVAERLEGFEAALHIHNLCEPSGPRWEIIERIEGDLDVAEITQRLRDAHDRRTTATCIVSLGDGPVDPLVDALHRNEQFATAKLIAFELSPATYGACEAGRVHSVVTHDPKKLGELAVAWSARLVRSTPLELPSLGHGSVLIAPEIVRLRPITKFN